MILKTQIFKSIIIAGILIFLNVRFSSAQKLKENINYVGSHGGYNFSRINTSLQLQVTFQGGINAGLVYQNFNNKNFGTQIEINFTQRGGQDVLEKKYLTDTIGMSSTEPIDLKLNYIEIPCMSVLQIGQNTNKLNILIGTNLSYLLNQKTIFTQTPLTLENEDKVKRIFDLGVNAGIGYAKILKTGKIDIEFRYTHDLFSLYPSRSVNSSVINQNQVLSLKVAYLFKIEKKQNHVKNK
jgi:hypothetical protein